MFSSSLYIVVHAAVKEKPREGAADISNEKWPVIHKRQSWRQAGVESVPVRKCACDCLCGLASYLTKSGDLFCVHQQIKLNNEDVNKYAAIRRYLKLSVEKN